MFKYIIFLLILLLIIYVILTYNKLVKLKIRVEESYATMDVYLKKRWSLIPNVVETVKGYMKHEKKLIENLTKYRLSSYDKTNMHNKLSSDAQLSKELTKIIGVAENYPDLKANSNFLALSKQITTVEEDIANARKYYNATVRNYNEKLITFPSGLVARLFGFQKSKMYENKPTERSDIKVNI